MDLEPSEDNATAVAAAADAAIATAARGLGRPQDPAKKHPSYVSPYKTFTKFVDEMRRQNKLPAGSIYTTTRNINLFATDKLAAMVCSPSNTRKYILAITKFAEYEHFGENPPFVVESAIVKAALAEQENTSYPDHVLQEAGVLRHPKEGVPTNVLSQKDNAVAIDYALKNCDEWAELTMAWTKSFNEFLRGHSIRNLRLCDLISDDTHAPSTNDDDEPIITTVLRKGGAHKDRFKHNRVVGSFRHKNYLVCSQGLTSFGTWFHLRSRSTMRISFDTRHRSQPFFWRNIGIVGWSKYADQYDLFKQVQTACGISNSKVTHLRKAGMDCGGTNGLHESSLATTLLA